MKLRTPWSRRSKSASICSRSRTFNLSLENCALNSRSPAIGSSRQLCESGCNAGLGSCSFNDDRVEDFDIEQAVKFLAEEFFSLVNRRLHNRIVGLFERNVGPVCLEQVLIDMEAGPKDLEGRFESFDGILLGRLIQTFVINTAHPKHDSEVPALRQEHFVVPEAVEVDLGVESSGFLPRLDDTIDAEHLAHLDAGISCLAAS